MTAKPDDLLPHDDKAERAVLGCVYIDPAALHRITPILSRPADFYDQQRQWIYAAMLQLARQGIEPDTLSIWELLQRQGKELDPACFTIDDTPTSLHAEHYARIVADYAARRRWIAAAGEIARAAYDTSRNNIHAIANKEILAIGQQGGDGLTPTSTAIGPLYDQVEAWAKAPLAFGEVRGLATHLPSLDHLLGGMEPGTLIMLAGRPSMGKSALALEIGRRVAMKGRATVAIFDLEMTKQAILMRWASAMSQVESRKVKRGVCPEKYKGQKAASYFVDDDEMARYIKAMGELSNLTRLLIDDSPALAAADIRARCLHKAHQLGRLDLVIVDHTTIMASEDRYRGNTAKSEGAKSQQLKDLAKELDCPLLLVQQLSRATEGRSQKYPTLADLRDSGEHEQNADVVLGLYRQSYYKTTIAGTPQDLELEILGLKSREGPTAKVRMRYERHLHRFTEFQEGTR
jgi:replicative DNA helicase